MKYFIGFVIVAVLVAIISILLKRGLLSQILSGLSPVQKLPYKKKDFLLTKAERSFYEVLIRSINADLVVFTKIRVLDLVWLPKGTQDRQTHRNRVQSKHVDFVICSKDTLAPKLVIELNDSSHDSQSRRERDAFLAKVFDSCGLAFLQVPARRTYDSRKLAQQIIEAISGPIPTASEAAVG